MTVPALLAALVALLPLGYLLLRTAGAGPAAVWAVLGRERTLVLIVRSLGLAATVTAASVVLGVSLALLVTRTDLPGRRAVGVLAALPLAIPSYVAAFAWVATGWPVSGFVGATLVLTLCCYPYVYLPVVAAVRRVDPALVEVARSLGRSPWQAFATVTSRQLAPPTAAGALLVALYVLSDFGAVSLLRYDVFTRVIYTSYRASFDRTPAAVLSLVLVVLTVAIAAAERRLRGRHEAGRLGGGLVGVAVPVALGRWRGPLLGGVGLVLSAALIFPVAAMVGWSLRGASGDQVAWASLAEGAAATVAVAFLGALACTCLAVPVGVLAARHRSRTVAGIELAVWAGHALPGIVVALSLVFFGIRVAEPIYQRTPLLVLAYTVLFLPAAVGAVRAAVSLSSAGTEEMARSLGLSPLAVLRRVTLPLASPGIATGAALVFLTAMKELPATLLLRPTGLDTLATQLWTRTGVAAYGAAAPYALALVVLAVVPTLVLMVTQTRGTHRR